MSRCLRLLLACLVFSLLSLPMVAQAPPSADTYVTRANPATNYGSGPILAVQDGTTTYLQFDLSALPEGASIRKATLRLYVNSVLAAGSFDVYQVNDNWSENTLNYSNAPPLGASATAVNPINVSAASVNHFVMVDITPLVRDWLAGATENNGIALALAESPTANGGSFSFDSKENFQTGHEPELEIVLSASAAPICSESLGQGATSAATGCSSESLRTCCQCNNSYNGFNYCVNDLATRSQCVNFCAGKGGIHDYLNNFKCNVSNPGPNFVGP